MADTLTLGSLFDGSGGFPLSAQILGIKPVWASEIEPFPCRVTEVRFPEMEHFGDVSKLDGATLPPVDILTLGSPCQDLSIAGTRKGLQGSRSSLFYEAMRVVKEMRLKTNGNYPRFVVWENVTGALTSNAGADFQAVVETFCKTADEKLSVPRPCKWTGAGDVVADNFSFCWRVLNAQYWGVPQRRRRIYAVADFGSERAREILLNRNSVCVNFKESQHAWQTSARTTASSTASPSEDVTCFDVRLSSLNTKNVRNKVYETSTSRTLNTGANSPTSNQGALCIVEKNKCFATSKNSFHTSVQSDVADTLVATDYKDPPRVSVERDEYRIRKLTPRECARLQGFPAWWCDGLEDKSPTQSEIKKWREIFAEHARVQGRCRTSKTDAEIKRWLLNPQSDTAEYKMWGNGVALPCVLFVLEGIQKLVQK